MSTVNRPGLAPSTPNSVFGHILKGRYRLVRQLSDGPIGTLYLAEDLSTGNRVAVRILGSEFAGDEQFARALERHVLRLAALCIKSQTIVKVCEFGQAGESTLLLTMEYVDGKS